MNKEFSKEQIKTYLLVGLAGIHILISLFTIVPGYLSIDEAIYHWMARDFSASRTFELWNGYREFPSVELVHHHFRIFGDHIVPATPYLWPLLNLPLYRLVGFFGLFVLNSIAFIVLVAVCFALAKKILNDLNLALNASLIFIFGTFAWEYSQAAWPHITSMLFATSGFYFGVCGFYADTRRHAVLYSLAAGLLLGLSPGIRLDAIIFLPCLLMILLFAKPCRFMEAAAVCLASVPGLAALSLTNYSKFGMFAPLSVGGPSIFGEVAPFPAALATILGILLVIVWLVSRSSVDLFDWNNQKKFAIGLLSLLVLALAIPYTRNILLKEASQAYTMIVDLRILDLSIVKPALTRSAGGGVVYIGGQKKALLQSLPYLVILLIPLLKMVHGDSDFSRLCILAIVPVAFVVFFTHYNDNGGLCLNLRYLLPILPFTSILTAYTLRDLFRQTDRKFHFITFELIGLVTAFIFFLFTRRIFITIDQQEFPILIIPLILAGLLTLLLATRVVSKRETWKLIPAVAVVVFFIALEWAGLMAFFYDFPHHRQQRIQNFTFGGEVAQIIPSDSIFFTYPYIDGVLRLIDSKRVRIAFPGQDGFRDVPKLVAFHLNAGRRVFAMFPQSLWKQLEKGPLAMYHVRALRPAGYLLLAEISPREPRSSSKAGAPDANNAGR